ncbi:MAG: hypothetical protein CSA66_03475, partial [Proteobacteria bacterium]
IREAVDDAASRAVWARYAGWAKVATVAVAGLVVGLAVAAELGRGDGGEAPVRAGGRALVAVAPPAAPAIRPAASEGGARVALAEGDWLEAEGTARTIVAFGRHEIRLAPHTRVKASRWARDKVRLELASGEVRCDVNRAAGEGVFEVRSGDVGVRVLGTVFTVRREGEGSVFVSVSRGRVGVTDGAGAVREVAAGESLVVVGAEAAAAPLPEGGAEVEVARKAPKPSRADRRPRRGGRRVIRIEVPDQEMAPTDPAAGVDVRASLGAIEAAIDRDNCVAAVKALDALERAVGAKRIGARGAALRARCAK